MHLRNGAPLPDALVILRCDEDGSLTERTTDAAGLFTFPAASPGECSIQVLLGSVTVSTQISPDTAARSTIEIHLDPEQKYNTESIPRREV